MDDIKFNSINELYERVLPALKSKKKELVRNKIKFIDEKEIWNLLSTNIWRNQEDLTLADIVDDILNINNIKLIEFYHNAHRKNTDENLELPKLKNNN